MTPFHNIGIIIKRPDEHVTQTLLSLQAYLQAHSRAFVSHYDHTLTAAGHHPGETLSRTTLAKTADLVIVIGGDGTLLDAARSLAEYDVPLLGVNTGRLGFLADVSPEEIGSQLDAVFSGSYQEENRALIHCDIIRDDQTIASGNALNDVVLHARDSVRMIEFETRINHQLVHLQRADGIVVSTATGSTAYALSGGGPILHPELDALALVPICPHTLSNRPIVIPGNREITIRLCPHTRTQAQVAFDGQENVDLEPNDAVIVRKIAKPLRLIHPEGYDYFHILRKKLHWSEQP
ncbi:MAG TPA: NAD(+) kinase [Gammaproteobacteria bacterium]|nr:NAD(+) kinase [Gammaproteobacteria bacterium]